MIYVYPESYCPPSEWLDKASRLRQLLIDNNCNEVEIRRILNSQNNHIWTELKNDLESLSFGKCWYSEARELVSHYHVDHFRPKLRCIDREGNPSAGYWWLAYDWKNYRISGSVINTSKRDQFAVYSNRANDPAHPEQIDDEMIYLLDPLRRDDVTLIVFNENGEAMPINPEVEAWDHKRARYTIDTLSLNHPKLMRARKLRWQRMGGLINDINNRMQQYNHSPSASLRARVEGLKNEIREFISPITELSSTYRACLRASREIWALALLEEPIDMAEQRARYSKGAA